MSLSIRRLFVFVFLVLVCSPLIPHLEAIGPRQLAPHYRKWIEEDVAYIITQEERREYLRLASDEERDTFIKQFWESRNPTPHNPVNTFEEEHYRRLAYVRTQFGDERADDGWRTDMGRIYITLGPPQQRATYHQGMSTRPVELWFYQSPSPALPAYFNLVFYRPSEAEPFVLYSPRSDGPTKIVTNDVHDDAQALRTIDKSMGAEVTHAMVSLLPGESINIDHPNPTMSSDLLLDEIRNLPEQKLERARIERQRAANREVVSSNIFTGFHATELEAVVLRDAAGQPSVDFLMRNRQPDPSIIGTLPDQRAGYAMKLATRVSTEGGKAIYQQTDTILGQVSPQGAKAGKDKIFAAEGRLPLAPGRYVVETELTNELTHEGTRATTHVEVPAPTPDVLGMSGIIAYANRAERTNQPRLPFTFANLRFPPRGEQVVELHPGEALPVVFQLWLPSRTVSGAGSSTLHLHYTLGSVANAGVDPNRIDLDQEIEASDADAAGNLVTGRSLDTTNLQPGTYRLVIRAHQGTGSRFATATMTVRIVPSQVPVETWTAYGDPESHPAWQDQMLRGISAESQGNPASAAEDYRAALRLKPDAKEVQVRLDTLLKSSIPAKAASPASQIPH
jgi:GWxTD domain-containing protein